jgi:hypothetical protein
MSDRPEERPDERRRTGPLGGEDAQETRQVPAQRPANGQSETEGEATQRIAPDEDRRGEGWGNAEQTAQPGSEGTQHDAPEERETRVIRAGGHTEEQRTGELSEREAAGGYPRGYFEAADERESRLRDMYGGVDWLASFLGFVFAAVAGTFLGGIAGIIVSPLGFSLNLGEGALGAAAVTGLVVVAVIIFLTYLFGGYVAGRLARFDGGRNGAMTVAWSIIMVALVAVGGFLSLPVLGLFQDFITDTVMPALNGLVAAGLVGIAVLVGALLAALVGGLAGGRLGSRYHNEIDRTS